MLPFEQRQTASMQSTSLLGDGEYIFDEDEMCGDRLEVRNCTREHRGPVISGSAAVSCTSSKVIVTERGKREAVAKALGQCL